MQPTFDRICSSTPKRALTCQQTVARRLPPPWNIHVPPARRPRFTRFISVTDPNADPCFLPEYSPKLIGNPVIACDRLFTTHVGLCNRARATIY